MEAGAWEPVVHAACCAPWGSTSWAGLAGQVAAAGWAVGGVRSGAGAVGQAGPAWPFGESKAIGAAGSGDGPGDAKERAKPGGSRGVCEWKVVPGPMLAVRLAGRPSLALSLLPAAHTLAGAPEAEGADIRVAAVAGCCCWSGASAASRLAAACGLSSASCSLLAGMAGFDARLVLSVPGLSGREFNAAPAAAAATMARALGDSSGWSEDLRK